MPAAIPDYPGLLSLRGRGFVVLGAGQGIGEQACHALAQAGASVLCVDVDGNRAEAVARAVDGHACAADATERADMERVFDEARRTLGPVRGVVDIIGVARIKSLADVSDADWRWQFDMVLRHAMLTLQIGAEAVAEAGGGPISLVGSFAGRRAIQGQVGYGTAKAALHHLVRTTATELGPRKVRVNAVAPGFVRTPRLEQNLDARQWALIEGAIPLRKAAQPSEIAAALLFLSSDLASHVTGAILATDGGIANAAALPDLGWTTPPSSAGA